MTPAVPYAEVIGDPVAHSKSPLIHNFWLRALRMPGFYKATQVTEAELPSYLAERRADPDWRGCNATMPHKSAIIPHLDSVDPGALAIGAVNTVNRDPDGLLVGNNSDLHGIWRAIDRQDYERLHVVVVGSGGAARSAVYAMQHSRVGRLTILARDCDKARAIADRLMPRAQVGPLGAFPACDLLINATPLGMEGHPWPELDLSALPDHATVFDMVYAPRNTALLEAARHRGLATIGGLKMLVHQAQEPFTRFFHAGPTAEMVARLERELTP